MHHKAPAYHVPVLGSAVSNYLVTDPNGIYVDATLGGGGHAERVLERLGESGKLIGIDRDPRAIAVATKHLSAFADRVCAVRAPFWNLRTILTARGIASIAGILFDLGVSSHQIDNADRGFSFQRDGPLDMRMGPDATCTARDVVNSSSQRDLTRIIKTYGEERMAGRIASAICQNRPFDRTGDLARVIARHSWGPQRRKTLARVFQALRIEVNDELTHLEDALQTAVDLLQPGGRVGVLSYHGLEHRVVKRVFERGTRDCIGPVDLPVCACDRRPVLTMPTRRPLRPDESEIAQNPRARSAAFRVAQRLEVSAQPWACHRGTRS